MGVGGVLDRQPPVEELVRLDVRAGQVAVGVVLLGEEAAGAQHDDRHAAIPVGEPAEMLGGELGDAVDVARRERAELLVEPESAPGAAGLAGADLLGDHQRGRRGEDEAVVPGLRPPPRAGSVCR